MDVGVGLLDRPVDQQLVYLGGKRQSHTEYIRQYLVKNSVQRVCRNADA